MGHANRQQKPPQNFSVGAPPYPFGCAWHGKFSVPETLDTFHYMPLSLTKNKGQACNTANALHLPPLTMDNAEYQRFQDEDAWSLDETSSCSSSFTFIESTISTQSMPSDPKCRQHLSELSRRLLSWTRQKQKPDLYACVQRRCAPDHYVEALMPFIRASTDEPVWIVLNVLRCQHCGKCISEKDTRLEGCRDCKCDYCPRRHDYHFRRCGPGHSHRLRPRLIKQNATDGGVDVVEDSWISLHLSSCVGT